MNEKNINKTTSILRVLIAPLDWGLGHATRCIPIIHALLQENVIVFIAAEGATAKLLQKEFPDNTILPLKGYKITYPAQKNGFIVKMLWQVPHILSTIRYEKKWLAQAIADHSIDAVISDNRFGFYNKRVKSIYITHQLHIETNQPLLNKLAQKIHYKYINRFSECWVPDAEGNINLAGKLSHPKKLPQVPVKYIGALSRFKKSNPEKKSGLLIVLSGPEPQRTIFEELLLQQVNKMDLNIAFVRGLPDSTTELYSKNPNVRFYNHLSANELSVLIQHSYIVLSRSGYSTVMDLVALQQKAILVPTPGQTEQEYLACYLHEKKMFFTTQQRGFELEKVLENAEKFDFNPATLTAGHLPEIITTFLHQATAFVQE